MASNSAYTCKILKDKLKSVGLSTSGRKAKLMERWQSHCDKNQKKIHEKSESDTDSIESCETTIMVNSTVKQKESCMRPAKSFYFSPRDVMEVLPAFSPSSGLMVEQWVRKVSDLWSIYNWDEMLLLFCVSAKLEGVAKVWLDTSPTFTKWENMKAAIIKRFAPVVNEADIHLALIKRHRKPSESLLEYLVEILRIGVSAKISEPALVKYFILGMRDDSFHASVQSQRIEEIADLRDRIEWYSSIKPMKEKKKSIVAEGEVQVHSTNADNRDKSNITCFNCRLKGHISKGALNHKEKPDINMMIKLFKNQQNIHHKIKSLLNALKQVIYIKKSK